MEVIISQADHYTVYSVISAGMPRDHLAIFVETNEQGLYSGHIFQVSGNIQQGMYHNYRSGPKPEEDLNSAFISKEMIGYVRKADYDAGLFRALCDSVEAPVKQFDGPKRIDRTKPLRRCGEWARDVVSLLRDKGFLLEHDSKEEAKEGGCLTTTST